MKASEIAKKINCETHGDVEIEILGVASLDDARDGDIAFSTTSDGVSTSASCVIVPDGTTLADIPSVACVILSRNPKLDFARAASLLIKYERVEDISPRALIADDAKIGTAVGIGHGSVIESRVEIGENSSIGNGCVIGRNVSIGKRCRIAHNVTIGSDTIIGDDAVIHSGVVIGAEGFGFAQDWEGRHVKFPQVGIVKIGNDVEIGANTCIDRGSLGNTEIGDGTKIDNLVQIAHNVKLGKRVLLAAQVGIAGSSIIGDDCVLAGQVGIADHVELKPGTAIGGKSLVNSGKILRGGVWWGVPVMPISEAKKVLAETRNIDGLGRTLREIKREIEELKSKLR